MDVWVPSANLPQTFCDVKGTLCEHLSIPRSRLFGEKADKADLSGPQVDFPASACSRKARKGSKAPKKPFSSNMAELKHNGGHVVRVPHPA